MVGPAQIGATREVLKVGMAAIASAESDIDANLSMLNQNFDL